MATKSRASYITGYIKNNIKRYELKLSKKNDGELIKRLENVPNRNSYLKTLILNDINQNK